MWVERVFGNKDTIPSHEEYVAMVALYPLLTEVTEVDSECY